MKINPPEYICRLKPYVAGKPIEELEREYGIKNAVKLASNENPFGPSPKALKACEEFLKVVHRYPDSSGHDLISKISEKFNLKKERIILGNGSDDIISLVVKAYVKAGDRVVIPDPGFLMYEISSLSEGADIVKVPLKNCEIDLEKMGKEAKKGAGVVFITNPNNPTGSYIRKEALIDFLKAVPKKTIVVVDEAYMEFADIKYNSWDLIDEYKNVISTRTFSKAYGLAGLRLGYGVMDEEVAGILNRVRQPFNTSIPSQVAGIAALDDDEFLARVVELVAQEKVRLYKELENLGLKPYKTDANFILIDVKRSADEVYEKLLYKGVITRSLSSYGYPEALRVSIGLRSENQLFLDSLKEVIKK